jgi:hypothetical protein
MDDRERQPPSGEEEEQVERDIEVSDLDVDEEDAEDVSGGRRLVENPTAGGETRQT